MEMAHTLKLRLNILKASRRKFFMAIFFCVCIVFSTYAGSLSSSLTLGINGEEVHEIVDSKYAPLSKLIWKDPIFMTVGVSEKISISDFSVDLGMNFVIPNEWGTMTDYDY